VEEEAEEEENEREKLEQDNNNKQRHKMALDFLLDSNVKRLLPELVQQVIKAVRENDESEVTLLPLVQSLLSDEKYLPIVSHEFYQTMENQISMWLTKMSPSAKLVSNLNEEHVPAMVNSIINVITTSLASQKDEQAIGLLWNPMNFLLAGGFQQNVNNSVTHHGIICDECGMDPIQGTRYKCTLCPNYDLCCECESSKKHDPNHPLMKMNTPVQFGGGCMNRLGGSMPRCTRSQDNPLNGSHHWQHKRGKQFEAQLIKEEKEEPIFGFVNTIAQKTWTVKNVGSEEWGEGVELVFRRGNEGLTLEKRYTVSNTKPNENAQVSAAVQFPPVPGRFSACFQLKKHDKFFGPRLWVDVHALEENKAASDEKEKEKEKEKENTTTTTNEKETLNANANANENKPEAIDCICICGELMVLTSPMLAYDGAGVNCDLCGVDCPSNDSIFHCFSTANSHPKGYDLCLSCAQSRMKSFEQPQDQMNEEEAAPVRVSDPWDGFEYAKEARELVEMGFTDVEIVKELLTSKKGNVNEVLAELLSQ